MKHFELVNGIVNGIVNGSVNGSVNGIVNGSAINNFVQIRDPNGI